jgi:hypothetical protein
MRALREDEVSYLLDDWFHLDHNTETDPRVVGVERRLKNLGIIEVDIPRIPGRQSTIHRLTKKGVKVREELRAVHTVLREISILRRLVKEALRLGKESSL